MRRVVELTGLGIAATYFLDPNRGSARRRAAWSFVAGGRRASEPQPPRAAVVAPAAAPAEPPAPEPEPVGAEPAPPPQEPGELVLVRGDELPGAAPEPDGRWPAWGWTLVVTITVCALAAFAAVGLGIWAIEHRTATTETRTVTTPATAAAPVLADPVARRIIGRASEGNVILRLDAGGAALAVDALPALAPGSRYRVWITEGGATTAAGGFAGRRTVLALRPLAAGSRVTITREPAGAAPDRQSGPQVASVGVPP